MKDFSFGTFVIEMNMFSKYLIKNQEGIGLS